MALFVPSQGRAGPPQDVRSPFSWPEVPVSQVQRAAISQRNEGLRPSYLTSMIINNEPVN